LEPSFTVPTPWRIEFEQDILLIVNYQFLVRMSDDNNHWALLGFGNWFGFDAGLDFAIKDILYKLGNIFGIDLL